MNRYSFTGSKEHSPILNNEFSEIMSDFENEAHEDAEVDSNLPIDHIESQPQINQYNDPIASYDYENNEELKVDCQEKVEKWAFNDGGLFEFLGSNPNNDESSLQDNYKDNRSLQNEIIEEDTPPTEIKNLKTSENHLRIKTKSKKSQFNDHCAFQHINKLQVNMEKGPKNEQVICA